MAIVNRTLDATEQRRYFQVPVYSLYGASGVVVSGLTAPVGIVPWPCTFVGAQIASLGTSGSPTYSLNLTRFIAGSGYTTWALATGSSNVPAVFGTSGIGAFGTSLFGSSGMVCISASSTLAQLQANDVLVLGNGTANTASTSVVVGYVLQPTVDIKTNFGLGF